jgi:hypothetical protein
MTEMKKFQKALEQIAIVFTDPYEHVDQQSGVVETRNRMGFTLDKVLNAICYALANGADYTVQTTLPRAKESVQRALRAHKGDELSEVQLQRAVEWVQTLTAQLAHTDAAQRVAEDVYAEATGKTFSYRSRAVANEGVIETPAMAAAKALGIVANVAPGFGSAKAG